jgi:predicted dehydrogenase
MTYDVAFVGTGANPDDPSVEGFAMAYRHANGYEKLDDCDLVACADIVPENARAFAAEYGLPGENVYEDYEAMLREVEPDVVSVTVPPALHADIVLGCLRSGVPEAIHCEKPMAYTLREARVMTQEAERRDVRLTFNHQRRFGKPFREAKRLLDEGAIGELERVEVGWGDFYDTGSHAIDLCGYLVGERPAEWVLATLDYREEDVRFGVHQENGMLAHWAYDTGVRGLLATGTAGGLVGAAFRLQGTDGEIEIDSDDGPMLRVRRDGAWETVDTGEDGLHGPNYNDRSTADVIRALRAGEPSELRARNALNTAEIVFAGYESARRRGRVDLPADVPDHPLEAMVERGDLSPAGEE